MKCKSKEFNLKNIFLIEEKYFALGRMKRNEADNGGAFSSAEAQLNAPNF